MGADRSGSYYFQKISACGGLLLFLFSQNLLALIIFKNLAKMSFCFYYSTFKGGVLIIITPVGGFHWKSRSSLLDTPCKAGARSTLYVLDRTFCLSTNSKIRDQRAPHVTWRQVWVCRPIAPYPGEIWVLSQGSFFLKVLKKCPQTDPKERSKRVPERAAVKA